MCHCVEWTGIVCSGENGILEEEEEEREEEDGEGKEREGEGKGERKSCK